MTAEESSEYFKILLGCLFRLKGWVKLKLDGS
jgi:hypothetical protein